MPTQEQDSKEVEQDSKEQHPDHPPPELMLAIDRSILLDHHSELLCASLCRYVEHF